MKAAIFCVIAIWVGSAGAFDPAHVERLRNTGGCETCDLSGFKFPVKAYLESAKLERADLSGAKLSGTNLGIANLSGANISLADLIGANLTGTIGVKRF